MFYKIKCVVAFVTATGCFKIFSLKVSKIYMGKMVERHIFLIRGKCIFIQQHHKHMSKRKHKKLKL